MDSAKILLRSVTPDDRGFLLSTFTQGLYGGCPCSRMVPRAVYLKKYANPRVLAILGRSETRVEVAALPESPNTLLGYIIFEPPGLVHWIHVKMEMQKMGIARALWQVAGLKPPIVSTSFTREVRELMQKMNITFDPYLIP